MLVMESVCTTNVFACLVLLGKHVIKKPNAHQIVQGTVPAPMVCVIVNHHIVVRTVIRHWRALMIAIHAEFVSMGNVLVLKALKVRPAVLVEMSVQTNARVMVLVKLVDVFAIRHGVVKGATNLILLHAQMTARRVESVTTANVFVNLE